MQGGCNMSDTDTVPVHTPLLYCHKEVPKGWYMFIASENLEAVGLPDMRNMFFCKPLQQDICFATKKNKQGLFKVSKALGLIKLYGEKEGINIRARVVHRFYADGDALHACMIGPCYLMSADDLKKVEQYAANSIPGITSHHIGYHGKFDLGDDNIPLTPFEKRNDDKQVEYDAINTIEETSHASNNIDDIPVNISFLHNESEFNMQPAKKPKVEKDNHQQNFNTSSYNKNQPDPNTTSQHQEAEQHTIEAATNESNSQLPSTPKFDDSNQPTALQAVPTCCIKIWK